MIAGTLEIQLMANLARLAKDMSDAKSTVSKAMKDIDSAVSTVKSALQALGIGLSVNYFVGLVKGTIDAEDHLLDLSKTTNITVEDLSGLSLAAKQSGSDLDSIALSISKLSVNIGKEPEKFRELGISAKDPLEAFKQLADVYVALEDPQQRAAIAAAALGRSWQGAAPLLAEGSKRIGEMVENGKNLSGITEQAAKDAKLYNDQMAELNVTLNATRVTLVNKMLPAMNDIAEATRQAAKEQGIWTALWVAMGGAMAHLTGTTGNVPAAVPGILDAKKIKDGADDAAIASIIAADRAKKFLRDDYAERIAIIKVGGVAYADQIKTNNKLAELALKEGGISNQRTREDLLNTQSTNNADQIADAMLRQQEVRRLSQQGAQTPEKMKAAAEAGAEIEKLNQRLVDNETLTQAQIRAERTITFQAQRDQYNTWAESQIQVGLQLANSVRDQGAMENEAYDKRLQALSMYLDSAQGQIADADAIEQQMKAVHEYNLFMIEKQKNEAVRSMQIQTWEMAAELVQTFAGRSKEAAVAVIIIQKALAIAQVVMNTQVAVMRAYAEMGPYAGTAMAAYLEGLMGVQIALITATGLGQISQVGGGGAAPGGVSNPTSTISSQSPQQVAAVNQSNLAAQASSHTTVIEFNAKDDDIISGKLVRAFLAKLEEVTRDGGKVIISGSAG